ncbi:MAG: hypothetical protein ACRC0S_00950 [Fusobacteriaceae bacterium]
MKLLKENNLITKDNKIYDENLKEINEEKFRESVFFTKEITKNIRNKDTKIRVNLEFNIMEPYTNYSQNSKYIKKNFIKKLIMNEFKPYISKTYLKIEEKPEEYKILFNELYSIKDENIEETYLKNYIIPAKLKNLLIKTILISILRDKYMKKNDIIAEVKKIFDSLRKQYLKKLKSEKKIDIDMDILKEVETVAESFFSCENIQKENEIYQRTKISPKEILKYSLNKNNKELIEFIYNILLKLKGEKVELKKTSDILNIEKTFEKIIAGIYGEKIINTKNVVLKNKRMTAKEYWEKKLKENDFKGFLERSRENLELFIEAKGKTPENYFGTYVKLCEAENNKEKYFEIKLVYEALMAAVNKSKTRKKYGHTYLLNEEKIKDFVIHKMRNRYNLYKMNYGKEKYATINLDDNEKITHEKMDSAKRIECQIDESMGEKINNYISFANFNISRMLKIPFKTDCIGIKMNENAIPAYIKIQEECNYIGYNNVIYPTAEGMIQGIDYSELLEEQVKSLSRLRHTSVHYRIVKPIAFNEIKLENTTKLCQHIINNFKITKKKQLESANLKYIIDEEKLKTFFEGINFTLEKSNKFLSFNHLVRNEFLGKFIEKIKYGEYSFLDKLKLKKLVEDEFKNKEEPKFDEVLAGILKKAKENSEYKEVNKYITAYTFILREIYSNNFIQQNSEKLKKNYSKGKEILRKINRNPDYDFKNKKSQKVRFNLQSYLKEFESVQIDELKSRIQKEIALCEDKKNEKNENKEKQEQRIKNLKRYEQYVFSAMFIDYMNKEYSKIDLFKEDFEEVSDTKIEVEIEVNLKDIDSFANKSEKETSTLDWFNLGLYLDNRKRNKLLGALRNYCEKVTNQKDEIKKIILPLSLCSLIGEINYEVIKKNDMYFNSIETSIKKFIPGIKEYDAKIKKELTLNDFYYDASGKLIQFGSFEKIRKYGLNEMFFLNKDKFIVREEYVNKYIKFAKKEEKSKAEQLIFSEYSNIIKLNVLDEAMALITDIMEKYLSWIRILERDMLHMKISDKYNCGKEFYEDMLVEVPQKNWRFYLEHRRDEDFQSTLETENSKTKLKKLKKYDLVEKLFPKGSNNLTDFDKDFYKNFKLGYFMLKIRDCIAHLNIFQSNDMNKEEVDKGLDLYMSELNKLYGKPINFLFNSGDETSIFENLTLIAGYDMKKRTGMYSSIKHIFDTHGYELILNRDSKRIILDLKGKSKKIKNEKKEEVIYIQNEEKAKIMKKLLSFESFNV